ncbi:MAG: Mrp/NBP35 family ATP-binding protein [Oscillospiraceae bacterium]|nr:Mrp/NBP35 family ATP-binding protein [Oscillospiraceae bacterium]MBQ5341165.1 Mrp/NBP35 family ATP-binding protein [Oscillospiraceae bacterium]MBQ5342021.1 Mrp/NBP35 family ATP-binding protein [Oscillospiraceae bacterium]
MAECNHDCANCASNCDERTEPQSFLVPQNSKSSIKNVIAVVSGKGGVGKSLVTSLLASGAARRGFKTAILDADITGPSIPKALGLKDKVTGDEEGMYPVTSSLGIKVMSLNLLLDDDTTPVVWRSPIITSSITQFWSDTVWGDVDYMFVDMPPGTGDVPLTVFQSLPVTGIVIVTTPQDLVEMIVTKAVRMAGLLNIPVLALVENMSYLECPDCGRKIPVFGESHVEETAERLGIDTCARIPIDSDLSRASDEGLIEHYLGSFLDGVLDKIGATR